MAYRVVLIDDNITTVTSLQMTVDWIGLGFQVAGVAYDGRSGLILIQELKPDVIVTDIHMPDLDGLMMVEQAQEFLENARVIVITGYDKFQYAAQAIRLSVFDYVLKPIDNEELQKSLLRAAKSLDKERQQTDRIHQMTLYQQRTQLVSLLNESSETSEGIPAFLTDENFRAFFIMIVSDKGGLARPDLQRIDDLAVPNPLQVTSVILNQDLVLFCGLKEETAAWQKYAQELADQIQTFMPEIRMAVSTLHRKFSDIGTAYQEARQIVIGYCLLEQPGRLNFYDKVKIHPARDQKLSDLEQRCRQTAEMFGQYTSDETFSLLTENYSGEIGVLRIMLLMYSAKVLQYRLPNGQWPESLEDIIFKISQIASEREAAAWLNRFYQQISQTQSGVSALISNVLHYIQTHVTEGLKMENVASQFHVSASYLSARIRRETGKTYQQHVLAAKIAAAKQLLDDTRMRIEDIAYSIGYENYISFYNIFKRLEGMTPSEYRFRNCKDGAEDKE